MPRRREDTKVHEEIFCREDAKAGSKREEN